MVAPQKFPDIFVVEDHAGHMKLVFAGLQHHRHVLLVDVLGYERECSRGGRTCMRDVADDAFKHRDVGAIHGGRERGIE